MGIEIENDFLIKLPNNILAKIEHSGYNGSRRKLANHLNDILLKLASSFSEFEDYFVVVSMPLEVCKLVRSSSYKICKEDAYAFPDKVFCLRKILIIVVINYMHFATYPLLFKVWI